MPLISDDKRLHPLRHPDPEPGKSNSGVLHGVIDKFVLVSHSVQAREPDENVPQLQRFGLDVFWKA